MPDKENAAELAEELVKRQADGEQVKITISPDVQIAPDGTRTAKIEKVEVTKPTTE